MTQENQYKYKQIPKLPMSMLNSLASCDDYYYESVLNQSFLIYLEILAL